MATRWIRLKDTYQQPSTTKLLAAKYICIYIVHRMDVAIPTMCGFRVMFFLLCMHVNFIYQLSQLSTIAQYSCCHSNESCSVVSEACPGAAHQDWADRMVCGRLSQAIATHACEQLIVPQLCSLHCELLTHSTPQDFLTSQKRRNYYTSLFVHLASRLHSDCILCLWGWQGSWLNPLTLAGLLQWKTQQHLAYRSFLVYSIIHQPLCTTDIHQFV